jgi:hypothetical protein
MSNNYRGQYVCQTEDTINVYIILVRKLLSKRTPEQEKLTLILQRYDFAT